MSIPELGLTVVTVTAVTFVALALMLASAVKKVVNRVVNRMKNGWFL